MTHLVELFCHHAPKKGYITDDRKRKLAVNMAFDTFGQPTKPALLYHMKQVGVILGENNCASLEEIETALKTFFGEGSSIIMRMIYTEIEKPGT